MWNIGSGPMARTGNGLAAPWRLMRNPVMIPSKTSAAPCWSRTSRNPSRKPGTGSMQPWLRITGRVVIAATSCPRWGETR